MAHMPMGGGVKTIMLLTGSEGVQFAEKNISVTMEWPPTLLEWEMETSETRETKISKLKWIDAK